jgi:hypothetical protein
VSTRSAAWYAIPENQARRQKNMRLYVAAMVQLGQRYPDERRQAYRRALGGQPAGKALQQSYAFIRDAHKDEFRTILARLREA